MYIAQGVFTDFRTLAIILLAFTLVFFVLSIVPRGRNSNFNFTTVLSVSIMNIIFTGALLYTENKLINEFSLTEDKITFYLLVVVFIFSIVNPIIFKNKNQQNQRYRYRG